VSLSLTTQIVIIVVVSVAGLAMCVVAAFLIRCARHRSAVADEPERATPTGTIGVQAPAPAPAPAEPQRGKRTNQYQTLPKRPERDGDNEIVTAAATATRAAQRRSILEKSPSSRRRHLRDRPAAPLPGEAVERRPSRRRDRPPVPLPDDAAASGDGVNKYGQYGAAPAIPDSSPAASPDEPAAQETNVNTVQRRSSKRHDRRLTAGAMLFGAQSEKTMERKRSRRHHEPAIDVTHAETDANADADAPASQAPENKRQSAELAHLSADTST